MREFDAMIFMGAGDRSMADSYRLHTLLEKSLEGLSALQQGLGNYNKSRADDIEASIEESVKDICAALLGKEITIGAELPYPGKVRREDMWVKK